MTSTYAIIATHEIQDLAKKRASAITILVYTTLLTYAQGKTTCFPKVETIRERLGGVHSRSSIMRALAWLCEHGFVKRGHRRSKERFQLLKRAARKVAEAVVNNVPAVGHTTSQRCDHKKTKNKPFMKGSKIKSFFRSRRKKQELGYGRFGSSENEADNAPKCKAESVFGTWMVQNPSMDIKTLSTAQKNIIVQCLRSPAAEDKEWREIMSWSPKNKAVFDYLLLL